MPSIPPPPTGSGDRTVWWRDRETGTLERCSLAGADTPAPVLRGTVLPQDEPLEITYRVETDGRFRTRRVGIEVVDTETGEERRIELSADGGGRWWVHGEERPDLAGCLDVDLAFTPATNTLPIRRLALASGERAAVSAAWVRWPSLEVARLEQEYVRRGRGRYGYRSGEFRAEITVDDAGLVVDYPGGWERVAGT